MERGHGGRRHDGRGVHELLRRGRRCASHRLARPLRWNYYGERAVVYLAGRGGILPYRVVFIVLIALGAFLKLEAIWILADIVNGLMAIPNLIALLALSGVVVRETRKYMEKQD